ncbi:MAG: feruloyl-CoA synthetase, partial [Pseudomonadota bacterium]
MHYAQLAQAREELTGPGGAFEIVTVTVGGVPVRAYRHALPDVRALWHSTAQFADRTYLVYGDERLTYAEAHTRVNAIAAWLAAQGVSSGDRVAIAMRNYPEWMLIYWACVST